MKAPFVAAIFLVSTGCAVGPDYTRPITNTADVWIESSHSELSADSVNYGSWWTVFKDPVLDQLVQIASTDNLPLQIAAVRILEARAGLGIARGFRFPHESTAY